MADLLVILAAGAVTYAIRASFIAVLGAPTGLPGLERALGHVKPAVLAALVGTSVMAGQGGGPSVPVLAALAAAAVLAVRRGPLVVIGAGMAVLWTLAALVG